MGKEKKTEAVEELAGLLSQSKFVVATDYRGLTVVQMSELRRQLRGAGSEYHVVKNTLTRFAAETAGKQALAELLEGPTALAFCHGDMAQLAKALTDYMRTSKTSLSIKGAIIDGRLIDAEGVRSIAALPPINMLRARLMGQLLSPIYSLHYVLTANLRGLATVLNARIEQLGGTTNV